MGEDDQSRRVHGGALATWLGIVAMVIIFVASVVVAARSEVAQPEARSAIAAGPL
ncbi:MULTISPECIES: hypothetical protein [Phenylobacterium]|uniref:Uncharacterized protein n=1 Tax=Phenylobacterium koreense TaxID=266125 RepID=A0ABV2EHC8_9CAUL